MFVRHATRHVEELRPPHTECIVKFRIGENSLGVTIPSSIIELKKLGKLNISNNGLRGDIPSGFSKLEMLEQLDASYNHLTGTLASLAELRALTQINISYNLFTGQIRASFTQLVFLFLCGESRSRLWGHQHCCLRLLLELVSSFNVGKETSTTMIPNMGYDKEEDVILFQKVMEATEDLNDKYIIGRGAHGTVYKT
ncbi:receptor-like protein kinase, partial [Tanacetum coccineum]